jgi:hypothetical protein
MTRRLHRPRFDWWSPANSIIATLSRVDLTAWKIVTGVALVVLSFLVSALGIEYFQPAWHAIGLSRIVTFGNASVSPRSPAEGPRFRFPGDGYV